MYQNRSFDALFACCQQCLPRGVVRIILVIVALPAQFGYHRLKLLCRLLERKSDETPGFINTVSRKSICAATRSQSVRRYAFNRRGENPTVGAAIDPATPPPTPPGSLWTHKTSPPA